MSKNYEIPEILAPVGSVEAFYAAIVNGCDAIYLGGRNFGARAYANNFDEEELRKLVDYAHLFHVQVYYTINTIVKDIEFKLLHQELLLLREVNIDAVIIQDLGVYYYIMKHFSDLVVHGSTQMNLHSTEDVIKVKELGFDRVVLSRECSLSDIRTIKDHVDIEIEAFVHGALCYCYSGQCLMSSMYGGRSGNRGKCAQPCRMPYEVEGEAGYFLSPKDQMTLEILPELIKAGVNSFKIEGRMKSAEYVGFATRIYKKYRDLSLQLIEKNEEHLYKVNAKDIQKLNQLFNRGNFTTGYYEQHNSKDMISYTHGKNQGVKIGKVNLSNKGFVFNLLTDVSKEDLLEIHSDINLKKQETWPAFTFNENMNQGKHTLNQLFDSKQSRINVKDFQLNHDYDVYRIRDKKLLEELLSYITDKKQHVVQIKVIAKISEPLQLEGNLCWPNSSNEVNNQTNINIKVIGNIVESALKRGTTQEDFIKQLSKTKDTSFLFEQFEFDMDEQIFVPLGLINELRRSLIEKLEEEILNNYRLEKKDKKNTLRDIINTELSENLSKKNTNQYIKNQEKKSLKKYSIMIRTSEQLDAIVQLFNYEFIQSVYIDLTDIQLELVIKGLSKLRQAPIQLFIALPHVLFNDYAIVLNQWLKLIETDLYDGFLIRTLGQIQIANHYNKFFVTDYNLHCFNSHGLEALIKLGASAATLSQELNKQGMKQIISSHEEQVETVIYGRSSLMQSANCVFKTRTGRCEKTSNGHDLKLEDRKGVSHLVKCHCNMCYNTIYNKYPLFIQEETRDFGGTFRLDFTSEDREETLEIMNNIFHYSLKFDSDIHTRGHFNKGVK